MKMFSSSLSSSKVTVLLGVFISLATAGLTHAQVTTFVLPYATGANYATGTFTGLGASIVSSGSVFSNAGPVTNNLMSVTFGQNFTLSSSGTGPAGTGAWAYQGNISGANIGAGTVMPISYDFSIDANAYANGIVSWVLYFRGGTNPEVQVASGTLSGVSQTFIGSASNYTFTSGATAGSDTYRAYLGISLTNNTGAGGQAIIAVTMADSRSFGGPGITLGVSAIPEPSTYAAIAGAAMLGLAVWHRRRRSKLSATLV